MKKTLIIPLILIILSFTTIATGEYYYPGYDTRNIDGLWSTSLDTDEVTENFIATSSGINSSWNTPLIGDLNNDGTNEIVIVDGANVEVYQTKTLSPIAGETAEDSIQHSILYDIDGDSSLEIITAGGDKISIFAFNGTVLSLANNMTINNLAVTDNSFMISCRASNDCMLFNARDKDGVPSVENMSAYWFSATTINSTYTSLATSMNNGDWTLPKVRTVSAIDYDFDGITEYVFSAYDEGSTAIKIFHVYMNSGIITTENTVTLPAGQVFQETNRDDFTSPLVGEFDSTSAGMETVIAYQADSTAEFEMVLLSKTGVEIDDYPELTFTQGTLISNPIKGNFIEGSANADKDFCVMGYDTPNDKIILLCGSTTADHDSAEYDINVSYDLSEYQYYPNVIIHAIQTSQSTTDGVNFHEFLTPYGVYSIDYDGLDEAFLQYSITTSSYGIAVPSDVEKTKYFDILYRTNDGLYYIDDGFSNSQANIDSYTFSKNPICVNRTYTLTLDVSDEEGDTITCWVSVLLNNETNIWNTSNKTAASSMSIYIKPNETGYFYYDMYCTDSIAVTPDYERKSIEVSSDTDVCYAPGEADEKENFVSNNETVENEEFTSDVDTIFDNFGLSSKKARNILAIIIGMVIAIIVYLKTNNMELSLAAKVSSALVFYYLGLMSLLPLVIVILVVAYLMVRKLMSGNGG